MNRNIEAEQSLWWIERSSFGVWVAVPKEKDLNGWFHPTKLIKYSEHEKQIEKLNKENEILKDFAKLISDRDKRQRCFYETDRRGVSSDWELLTDLAQKTLRQLEKK